ncbi:MAG TPA: hypothetical protein VHZ04_02790 [Candidatus Paceibacterota bacterium]|nr:hypothetical protein [Candidatus Paceibacterota bacterium]
MSQEGIKSRPAEVADSLTLRRLKTGSMGFVDGTGMLVCLMPGSLLEVRQVPGEDQCTGITEGMQMHFLNRKLFQKRPLGYRDVLEFCEPKPNPSWPSFLLQELAEGLAVYVVSVPKGVATKKAKAPAVRRAPIAHEEHAEKLELILA